MPWRLLTLCLLLTGCGRGCEGGRPSSALAPTETPPAAALPHPSTPTQVAPRSLPDSVESRLGIALPRRHQDSVLPGLATFPHRVLQRFPPDSHLIARLDQRGLLLLDQLLTPAELADDDRLQARMRAAAGQWGRRSGTAATRLYLAFDRQVNAVDAARLRRLAMKSHNWRVVGLARDGDRLLELLLGPAPATRPGR